MKSTATRGWAIAALAFALALILGMNSIALAAGPYTIRGVVLGVDGKPVAGYPLIITPHLPNLNGMDFQNVFYKIVNRDDHLTYTDSTGQFVMTNVVDYPQVEHHGYRIWGGGDALAEKQAVHPFIRPYLTIDLSTGQSNELYVVIKSEPASALRIVAKDPSGRPYTGSVSVSVVSGKNAFNRTAFFKNGVHVSPGIPAGNPQEWGKVIILPEKTAKESQAKAVALGQQLGQGNIIRNDALLEKRVQFLPFQMVEVEVSVPFVSE